jgi:hypothetical protein
VSKSSVYREYVDMCRREGRPALFTRAVVGKMVKRAFPDVRTKRSGPRHRVTQYYLGLRRSVMTYDPRPVPAAGCNDDALAVPPVKEGVGFSDVLDRDPGSSGSCEWSVANPFADPQQQLDMAGHDDWKDLERQWDSTFTQRVVTTTTLDRWTTSAVATPSAAGDDEDLDRLLAWADTLAAQDEDELLLLAPDVCPGHSPSW